MNWLDFVLIGVLVVSAVLGMRMGVISAIITAVVVFGGWLLAGQLSDDVGGLFADSLSNDTLVTVISYAIVMIVALIVAKIAVKIIKPLLAVFTLGLSSLVDRLVGLTIGVVVGVALASAIIIGMARLTYNFEVSDITAGVSGRVQQQITEVEDLKKTVESTLTGTQMTEQLAKLEDVKASFNSTLTNAEVSDGLAKLDDVKKSLEGVLTDSDLVDKLGKLSNLRKALQRTEDALEAQVEDVKEQLETYLTESKLVPVFVDVVNAIPGDALGFVPSDFKVALEILEENLE